MQVACKSGQQWLRVAYRDSHVLMLAALILTELLLAFLDGHILEEVCIIFALRALEAQLAEKGHHLSAQASLQNRQSYLCDRSSQHALDSNSGLLCYMTCTTSLQQNATACLCMLCTEVSLLRGCLEDS